MRGLGILRCCQAKQARPALAFLREGLSLSSAHHPLLWSACFPKTKPTTSRIDSILSSSRLHHWLRLPYRCPYILRAEFLASTCVSSFLATHYSKMTTKGSLADAI